MRIFYPHPFLALLFAVTREVVAAPRRAALTASTLPPYIRLHAARHKLARPEGNPNNSTATAALGVDDETFHIRLLQYVLEDKLLAVQVLFSAAFLAKAAMHISLMGVEARPILDQAMKPGIGLDKSASSSPPLLATYLSALLCSVLRQIVEVVEHLWIRTPNPLNLRDRGLSAVHASIRELVRMPACKYAVYSLFFLSYTRTVSNSGTLTPLVLREATFLLWTVYCATAAQGTIDDGSDNGTFFGLLSSGETLPNVLSVALSKVNLVVESVIFSQIITAKNPQSPLYRYVLGLIYLNIVVPDHWCRLRRMIPTTAEQTGKETDQDGTDQDETDQESSGDEGRSEEESDVYDDGESSDMEESE